MFMVYDLYRVDFIEMALISYYCILVGYKVKEAHKCRYPTSYIH